MSQEALSYESGLHPNFISLVELGKRGITVDSLFKLAYGLGCSVSDLVKGMTWAPEED
jgi:XRE family transcriptional regulator, regulator of sulfur utilization